MTDDINPYQSPEADISPANPRPVPRGKTRIFIVGAALGCLSFLLAISLIPNNVLSPSEHDLLLANHLGFLFPPLVGAWVGWIRRSLFWGVADSLIGIAIGGFYYLLCGHDFIAIMVAFPCLLGGVASVAFGTGNRSWLDGILIRLGKGLVAGFVLGFVYMVVLNVLALDWLPLTLPFPQQSIQQYHQMMWKSGPIAMSLASGLYFLFIWASNLRVLSTES